MQKGKGAECTPENEIAREEMEEEARAQRTARGRQYRAQKRENAESWPWMRDRGRDGTRDIRRTMLPEMKTRRARPRVTKPEETNSIAKRSASMGFRAKGHQ